MANLQNAEFIKGATAWEHFPTDGRPEVTFMGRSNVGKSSLINLLLRRKNIARTSGQPGKTQEINFFLIDGTYYLVDLPGYGYAKTSKKKRKAWSELNTSYLLERPQLRAVFHLIDSRHPPTELDEEMIELMLGQHVPYVAVLTKVDKLSGNQRGKAKQRVIEALGEYGLEAPVILSSAETGRGRKELLEWLDHFVV